MLIAPHAALEPRGPVLKPWCIAWTAALLLSSACGGESKGAPGGGGSAAGLVVEAIGYTDPTEATHLLTPGSSIELWGAPQGGHVSRIGARVANLDSNTIELRAQLFDLSGAVFADAKRTTPVSPSPGLEGVQETDRTDLTHFAHIPLCPDPVGRAIDGQTFLLQVSVTELYADFSEGSTEVEVVAHCALDDTFCSCECAEGYDPSQCQVN